MISCESSERLKRHCPVEKAGELVGHGGRETEGKEGKLG